MLNYLLEISSLNKWVEVGFWKYVHILTKIWGITCIRAAWFILSLIFLDLESGAELDDFPAEEGVGNFSLGVEFKYLDLFLVSVYIWDTYNTEKCFLFEFVYKYVILDYEMSCQVV